jgi:hypothetical protein
MRSPVAAATLNEMPSDRRFLPFALASAGDGRWYFWCPSGWALVSTTTLSSYPKLRRKLEETFHEELAALSEKEWREILNVALSPLRQERHIARAR